MTADNEYMKSVEGAYKNQDDLVLEMPLETDEELNLALEEIWKWLKERRKAKEFVFSAVAAASDAANTLGRLIIKVP